ncbi:MAG: hypothetical protein SNJ67_08420 [Chloracidobacterium sp.]|uniref:Uncharacterized protein n=1 Tax=Chloracidobacterium validum TaxID=2821543 RepID=A0ABX8BCX8_9BACT|nr:hypothetical protein [Chloracidobacterium validum]QUW04668.1 hypothetical protein J8C06_12920 [Chloracidobacterium validum]
MASVPLPNGRSTVALHERAEANLRFIRETMERAALFTAVPGWGMVAVGLTATVAAILSAAQPSLWRWLLVWLGEAGLALTIGASAMWHKARRQDHSLASAAARRFFLAFVPPLVVGGLLSIVLVGHGVYDLLPGTWLLLYGTGVMASGAFSVRVIPLLGLVFLLLGGITLFLPFQVANWAMGLGFGVFHIGFGLVIARKYGG